MKETVESIRDAQGWDDETLVLLLKGFVVDRGLEPEFVAHLRKCADEENAEADAYMDVCACGERYTDGDADEDQCGECRRA